MPLPATVDDAYSEVDPDVPLYAGEADPRYVDLTGVRGGDDLAALIARQIRRSDRRKSARYLKLLFTGHRGSGKTTELARLKRKLEAEGYFVVYTVPLSLLFNRNVAQIFPDGYFVVPMVKIAEEDGRPSRAGQEALYQVLARRMELSAIFESDALVWQLVRLSGGHIRDLLRLVRYAFDYTDAKVGAEQIERARRRLLNEYDRLVRDSDLPRLHQVHIQRRVPSDPEFSPLLFNLLVLEYQNGERWADVHPAVLALEKFRRYAGMGDGERDEPQR